MENGLFADTAPPPQTVKVTEEYIEDRQIFTFNEQILSAFDSIQPKIDSLERSLKQTEKHSLSPIFNTSSKLSSSLLDLQASMPNIHDKSINLSRRIQNISLKAQESATIAAPKRLKPIIEDFNSLKIEFNQSLKHISIFTENLNEQIEKVNEILKKASEDSKMLKSLKIDIEKSKSANKKNSQMIDELKEKIINQSRNERLQLISNFEQSLIEAENLVDELESLAEKGLDNSNKTIVKLNSEKFDIQSSFESLSKDIENSMNDRISEIQSKIERNSEKSEHSLKKIDLKLASSLDKIVDRATRSPALSLLDKIEQKKQNEELEDLLNRIDSLKQKIHELDPPNKMEQLISQDLNEKEEDNHVKIFTTVIDGKKKKISCFENGTFEIQNDDE